jgi:preprotein translocase subunit SecD
MLNMARWQIWSVIAICVIGLLYAVPNLIPREKLEGLPNWLPKQQVNLGLDLQGGAHLLLEVDLKAVVRERLTNLVDAIRTEMRTKRVAISNIATAETPEPTISFRVRDAAQVESARTTVRELDPAAVVTTGPDNTVTIRFNERDLIEQRRQTIRESIETVRRRIDETGTKEATIVAQGQDRILVQLPGERNPQRIKDLLKQTAKMNFHLLDTQNSVEEALRGNVPAGSVLMPMDKEVGPDGKPRMVLVQRRVIVAGDRLSDAQPSTSQQTGEWIVNFVFDSLGGKRFGDATRENVGRPLAIVLDNKVISAPVIREPILGGRGQISGNFSAQSAQDLALLLRAGALPAPLNVIEERTVGPDLGSDSIRAGEIACIIGYALIAALMIVGYGLFGIVANIALILNVAFTLSIMAAIGATLTLPGIAGIVLGLAMSVDANVLIYERMREETRNGRSPFPAVDVSFQRAYITIIDSNLTTLIAALILYALGSGPVRGFGVTLAIGIMCSMFTSVTVTRLIISSWLHWRRPKELPI